MEEVERQAKLILDSIEKVELVRDTFFKTVIDFLKWTTTFTFAAIVWITSNYNNSGEMKQYLILGLVFLVFSVIVSIITVYAIVLDYGRNWDTGKLVRNVIIKKFSEKKQELKTQPDINPSWFWKIIPMTPKQFNYAIIIHLILVLSGLLCYAGVVIL